eukprot:COSAG04_NODE_695_length_11066_cov_14.905352_4_plen_384_part_00
MHPPHSSGSSVIWGRVAVSPVLPAAMWEPTPYEQGPSTASPRPTTSRPPRDASCLCCAAREREPPPPARATAGSGPGSGRAAVSSAYFAPLLPTSDSEAEDGEPLRPPPSSAYFAPLLPTSDSEDDGGEDGYCTPPSSPRNLSPEPEPLGWDTDPEVEIDAGVPASAVVALRARCRDALAKPEGASLDDIWTLSRFLKARNGDLDDAEEMLRGRVAWVERVGLMQTVREWKAIVAGRGGALSCASGSSLPEAELAERAVAAHRCAYGGLLNDLIADGSPVMVERLAKCDFAGIAREGPGFLSLMLTAYAVYLESVVERVTAESRRQRRLVKAVCVVDMEQYGLSHLWHINTFKPFTSIGPTYYPEFTTRVLIGALCNCSARWH